MSIIEYTGPSNPQEIRKYLMRRTKEEIVSEYLRQWREFGDLEKERDAALEQVIYWRERAVDAEAREHALAAHVERLQTYGRRAYERSISYQEPDAPGWTGTVRRAVVAVANYWRNRV